MKKIFISTIITLTLLMSLFTISAFAYGELDGTIDTMYNQMIMPYPKNPTNAVAAYNVDVSTEDKAYGYYHTSSAYNGEHFRGVKHPVYNNNTISTVSNGDMWTKAWNYSDTSKVLSLKAVGTGASTEIGKIGLFGAFETYDKLFPRYSKNVYTKVETPICWSFDVKLGTSQTLNTTTGASGANMHQFLQIEDGRANDTAAGAFSDLLCIATSYNTNGNVKVYPFWDSNTGFEMVYGTWYRIQMSYVPADWTGSDKGKFTVKVYRGTPNGLSTMDNISTLLYDVKSDESNNAFARGIHEAVRFRIRNHGIDGIEICNAYFVKEAVDVSVPTITVDGNTVTATSKVYASSCSRLGLVPEFGYKSNTTGAFTTDKNDAANLDTTATIDNRDAVLPAPVMILAGYSDDGQLTDVKICNDDNKTLVDFVSSYNADDPTNHTERYNATLSCSFTKSDDTTNYKAFIWTNMSEIHPYFPAVTQ